MAEKSTEIVPFQPQPQLRRVEPRSFSLMPQSLGEAKEIAGMIAASDFAPKDYKGKPNNIIIALQMGADLGLKPMQALQNIAVINGRPSIYGDAALALVQAGDVLERFHETFEGEWPKDDFTAICIAHRKGWPDETRRTFSIGDAKAAGLWGKAGPWTTYPKRMMQFRARGFTLRDMAADLLLGLILAEEAQDYPEAIDVTPSVAQLTEGTDPMDRIPEGQREGVGKAFEALSMSQAQRLAKINEYLGKDGVEPEQGATALLAWCRDEYAKRKSGQPMQPKKVENGKSVPQAPSTPAESPVSVASSPASAAGGVLPTVQGPETLPSSPAPSKEVPVSEIPWSRGELF